MIFTAVDVATVIELLVVYSIHMNKCLAYLVIVSCVRGVHWVWKVRQSCNPARSASIASRQLDRVPLRRGRSPFVPGEYPDAPGSEDKHFVQRLQRYLTE